MSTTGYVIGAVVAVIAAVIGYVSNRGSATKAITDAATGLVVPMAKRIDELEDEVRALRAEVTDRRDLNTRLEFMDREMKRLTEHVATLEQQNAAQSARITQLEDHLAANGIEAP